MSEVTSTATEQTSINIQDIVGLLNVVDVAARRGAFKAEEMSTVGDLYNKVVGFLKATGAIKEEAPAEEAAVDSVEEPAKKSSKKGKK